MGGLGSGGQMNAAYELTKIPRVETTSINHIAMARCPKCGAMDFVDIHRPSQRCKTCGMLFQVKNG